MTGVGEPGDLADLGHKNRGRDPAHAVEGLNSPVALAAGQAFVDVALGNVDLVVKDLDEPAQGVDPVAEDDRYIRGMGSSNGKPAASPVILHRLWSTARLLAGPILNFVDRPAGG